MAEYKVPGYCSISETSSEDSNLEKDKEWERIVESKNHLDERRARDKKVGKMNGKTRGASPAPPRNGDSGKQSKALKKIKKLVKGPPSRKNTQEDIHIETKSHRSRHRSSDRAATPEVYYQEEPLKRQPNIRKMNSKGNLYPEKPPRKINSASKNSLNYTDSRSGSSIEDHEALDRIHHSEEALSRRDQYRPRNFSEDSPRHRYYDHSPDRNNRPSNRSSPDNRRWGSSPHVNGDSPESHKSRSKSPTPNHGSRDVSRTNSSATVDNNANTKSFFDSFVYFPTFDGMPERDVVNELYAKRDYPGGPLRRKRRWIFLGEIISNNVTQHRRQGDRIIVSDREGVRVPVYFTRGVPSTWSIRPGHTVLLYLTEKRRFLDGYGYIQMDDNFRAALVNCSIRELFELSTLYSKGHVCWWCQERRDRDSLRKCTGCQTAYYCNNECQKNDWMKRHRKVCKAVIPTFLKLIKLKYDLHNMKNFLDTVE